MPFLFFSKSHSDKIFRKFLVHRRRRTQWVSLTTSFRLTYFKGKCLMASSNNHGYYCPAVWWAHTSHSLSYTLASQKTTIHAWRGVYSDETGAICSLSETRIRYLYVVLFCRTFPCLFLPLEKKKFTFFSIAPWCTKSSERKFKMNGKTHIWYKKRNRRILYVRKENWS